MRLQSEGQLPTRDPFLRFLQPAPRRARLPRAANAPDNVSCARRSNRSQVQDPQPRQDATQALQRLFRVALGKRPKHARHARTRPFRCVQTRSNIALVDALIIFCKVNRMGWLDSGYSMLVYKLRRPISFQHDRKKIIGSNGALKHDAIHQKRGD